MPMGLVRSGDVRDGNPITWVPTPAHFGNIVAGSEEPFGNIEPQSNATLDSNPIGTAGVATFGNQVSFSLQVVPPVVIVDPGTTGTTDINLTNLLGANSATLTSFGAPAGVTVAFAPNPDSGTTVATITVGASVPAGRYTISVVGTNVTPNIEITQIHLVVANAGSVPPPSGPVFLASTEAPLVSDGGPNSSTGRSGGPATIDTTGATLFIAVIRSTAANATITDSVNNIWSFGTDHSANGVHIIVGFSNVTTTSTTHTFAPVGTFATAEVFAFKGGVGWTIDSDLGATSVTTGTVITTGSITPSVGEVVVAGLSSNGSLPSGEITMTNGFFGGVLGSAPNDALTQLITDNIEVGGSGYLIPASVAPINTVFTSPTSNTDWTWSITSFKHS